MVGLKPNGLSIINRIYVPGRVLDNIHTGFIWGGLWYSLIQHYGTESRIDSISWCAGSPCRESYISNFLLGVLQCAPTALKKINYPHNYIQLTVIITVYISWKCLAEPDIIIFKALITFLVHWCQSHLDECWRRLFPLAVSSLTAYFCSARRIGL